MNSWIDRAKTFWFGPVESIRLNAFSRCLSVALLIYIGDRSRTPYEWLTAAGYHPSPAVAFPHYPGPLPLLPPWLVPLFIGLFIGSIVGLVALDR